MIYLRSAGAAVDLESTFGMLTLLGAVAVFVLHLAIGRRLRMLAAG